MGFKVFLFLLSLTFYSGVSHSETGKAMSSFPEGEYSGQYIYQGDEVTLRISAKGNQLNFDTTSNSGMHGVGFLILNFYPNGKCEEDRGAGRSAYKGTCIDNKVKLRREIPSGKGLIIVELEYTWNEGMLYYQQEETSNTDGKAVKLETILKKN